MKILFVDEKAILLDGIAKLIAKSAHDLVEKANTVDDALSYFSDAEFDILITDFNLVDDNGLDLIRKAKKIFPKLKIIVLSMDDEAHLAKEIVKEGVDVIEKESHYDIVEALDAVAKGKVVLSLEINKILTQALTKNKNDKLLSGREKEVLKLISDDYTTNEIATVLTITEKTVETHRKNLFKKTKTSSVIGLLKYTYANNLI
jgi:DNA-binding NarL/FixJ family response regulator